MKNQNILIAEISGKRPGTSKDRPTEKMQLDFDKLIISNNSEGYETDWDIVNVPEDYKEWYCDKLKNSDNAWYAPMNRSYAIKYAKEHGYRYLVQLDDNICYADVTCSYDKDDIKRTYRVSNAKYPELVNDMILFMRDVLENTNAGMAGCSLSALSTPQMDLMSERYCYSFFMLDMERCPSVFHGDFEDDIEFRLKCHEMGVPVVQIPMFRYSKTGQNSMKDTSGCRAEYVKAGLKRGEHMVKLHGDIYSCRMRATTNSTNSTADGGVYFKHYVKPFKTGLLVKNKDMLEQSLREIIKKYPYARKDNCKIKEKKIKKKTRKS